MPRLKKRAAINKKIGEGVTKYSIDRVNKLKEVAALDGTVEEMCFYAEISKQTYYDWMKKYPKLSDEIEALRNKPVLAARRTVVAKMVDSYSNSMDYLSRKRKTEFSTRTELTGADGEALNPDEKAKIDAIFNENSGKK